MLQNEKRQSGELHLPSPELKVDQEGMNLNESKGNNFVRLGATFGAPKKEKQRQNICQEHWDINGSQRSFDCSYTIQKGEKEQWSIKLIDNTNHIKNRINSDWGSPLS